MGKNVQQRGGRQRHGPSLPSGEGVCFSCFPTSIFQAIEQPINFLKFNVKVPERGIDGLGDRASDEELDNYLRREKEEEVEAEEADISCSHSSSGS